MTTSHVVVKTDDLMWTIQRTLQIDLAEHIATSFNDIYAVRGHDFKIPKYASPYRVKANYQVAKWLKRYCFETDILTSDERELRTNQKFIQDQVRIGLTKPMTIRSHMVVQEARKIIKSVLGTYNDEDLHRLCTFSRNAVKGVSYRDVYLDKKIYPGSPVTGTPAEIEWFDNLIAGDPILARSLCDEASGRPNYVSVSHLAQVNVPKTAIINRPVRPNTLIGTFRSIGLGRLIAEKLKVLKINISTQQYEHQRLAKQGSRSLHNATMDLSSASDSFTPSLINRLLPREWYHAIKLGRTPYFTLGKANPNASYSPSFMAMGIGYTFPLMTLCFQAILLAIQKFLKIHGDISVFGDDLIFPSRMYHYVIQIFSDLGFKVNEDKTFVFEPFRESCGGDYYDEVDVRPASPEGLSELLEGENAISAYVYKLYNSLIRRWEEVELPLTFEFLRLQITRLGLKPYSVPSHFPDESGFKDGNWASHVVAEADTKNLRKPYFCGSVIPCLIARQTLRPAGYLGIYLWEKLQGEQESDSLYGSSHDVLLWRKRKTVNKYTKKSYRRLVAYTTRKGCVYFEPGLICATTV